MDVGDASWVAEGVTVSIGEGEGVTVSVGEGEGVTVSVGEGVSVAVVVGKTVAGSVDVAGGGVGSPLFLPKFRAETARMPTSRRKPVATTMPTPMSVRSGGGEGQWYPGPDG
jgi:hypothetical protein